MMYLMYKLKFFGIYALMGLMILVLFPWVALTPKYYKNPHFLSLIMQHIATPFGVRWTIKQPENINIKREAVVLVNHQSMLDLIGVSRLAPYIKFCTALGKIEIRNIFFFGLALYLGGFSFVDRKNSAGAKKSLSELATLMKDKKSKVVIFPEGTRSHQRGLLPFKVGGIKLAIEMQVPIIPVVLSPYYFINQEKHYFGNGQVVIKCLECIETKGLTTDNVEYLTEKVRNVMLEEYNKMCDEILSQLPPDYPLHSSLKVNSG